MIVGFDPAEGGDPSPRPAPTPLSTSTDATGGWAFIDPKQVFGSTEYRFEDGRYEPRSISITIDQGGRVGARIDPLDPLELDPDTLDVELDARGGQIGGSSPSGRSRAHRPSPARRRTWPTSRCGSATA